ncbi:Chaperone protein DnaJ [Durusdinium trenchii]|uniref:Chaperone protein DnaJ n=1 Tax=Durusdinium trenchii TaxID=1381693 RepID=A0ABP0LAM9_9DINO
MAAAATGLPDYYGLFGVEREVDQDAIKKVYRKLVLQWHPDKHPQNREAAEEKIREINDAYETLSNPFKRSQYDNMLVALERKAKGFRLDTTMIKPRMSIPKEFMLSPLGYPDKFVRVVGMSLFVQSRGDAKAEFYDFFKEAKFSLWWLPEVNNMCRIRPQATAGVGQDGGLNFNFALSRQVSVSERWLSEILCPDNHAGASPMADVSLGKVAFPATATGPGAPHAGHEGHVPASAGHCASSLGLGLCAALCEAWGGLEQTEARGLQQSGPAEHQSGGVWLEGRSGEKML